MTQTMSFHDWHFLSTFAPVHRANTVTFIISTFYDKAQHTDLYIACYSSNH